MNKVIKELKKIVCTELEYAQKNGWNVEDFEVCYKDFTIRFTDNYDNIDVFSKNGWECCQDEACDFRGNPEFKDVFDYDYSNNSKK